MQFLSFVPCNAQLTAAFSSLAKSTLTVVWPKPARGVEQAKKAGEGWCRGEDSDSRSDSRSAPFVIFGGDFVGCLFSAAAF